MGRIIKVFFLLLLLSGWIYFLGTGHRIANTPIPPLGKLMDPFHGYLQNGNNGDPDFSASVDIPGLSAPVRILYDSNMVPHIYAENTSDLITAQGYLTASLRLWQMDLQTRSASGRISEVMGPGALDLDRETRRKGIAMGAEKIRDLMKADYPEFWLVLEDYAEGVNAYINSMSYSDYPIEFKLLDYEPEKWDPANTVYLIQYMNNLLSGFDRDIENTNFAALFGEQMFDSIFYPSFIDPVVDREDWEFEPVEFERDTARNYGYDTIKSVENYRPNPANGSNNWAISGAKTRSGNPILNSDTHLSLWLPSLWNMMHLHSPELNSSGFTFSGSPGIIIGFNDSISWAFTNAPRDQRDWYDIEFRNNKQEYLYDGEWRPTSQRIEEIKIKGEEPFIDTVYYTHHGPVVFDDSFHGNGSRVNLALRWIGHEPSRILLSFWNIQTANNYQEFRRALRYWDSPPQNAVFASTNGDIAMTITGTHPLKWEGQGKYVLDGSNPSHDWQAFIPDEHRIFELNPAREFVSSANQYPVNPSYPYYVFNQSHEQYRNRIINRLLTAMDSVGTKDLMDMHTNRYNIKAEEFLPFMASEIDSAYLSDKELNALATLSNWNYEYLPELTQPVLFEYWWRYFMTDLWDEIEHDDYRLPRPPSLNTYELLRDGLIDKWIDNKDTPQVDSLSELVTRNFQRAVSIIENREEERGETLTWTIANNVRLTHMSTQLAPFNSELLPIGGSGNVIMAANGRHGPSQRMVVEMSNPPKAYLSLPGGLSGNPGSDLYMNYVPYYVNGEYIRVELSIAEENALFIQTLNPEE